MGDPSMQGPVTGRVDTSRYVEFTTYHKLDPDTKITVYVSWVQLKLLMATIMQHEGNQELKAQKKAKMVGEAHGHGIMLPFGPLSPKGKT